MMNFLAVSGCIVLGYTYRFDVKLAALALEEEVENDGISLYDVSTDLLKGIESMFVRQDNSALKIVLLAWVLTALCILAFIAFIYVYRNTRKAIEIQNSQGSGQLAKGVFNYDQDDSDEFESEDDAAILLADKPEIDMQWCSREDLAKSLQEPRFFDVELIQPRWTSASVGAVLQSHGVSSHSWSEHAQRLLACELSNGQARLCKKGTQLLRILDIVIVFVVYEPEQLVLQMSAGEEGKWTSDSEEYFGRTMQRKLTPGESISDCMRNAVYDHLQIDMEGRIDFNSKLVKVQQKIHGDHSTYRGLATLSRVFMFEATVTALTSNIERLGIPSRSLYAGGCKYVWEDIRDVREIRKAIRSRKSMGESDNRSNLDHSLVPVTSWNHTDLTNTLRKYGVIDPLHHFGMDTTDLLCALREARLALGLTTQTLCDTAEEDRDRNEVKDRLVCLTEKVSMVVKARDGRVLVRATPVSSDTQFELPSIQKFASEHIWLTALRLLWHFSLVPKSKIEMDAALLALGDTIGSNEDCLLREFVIGGPI